MKKPKSFDFSKKPKNPCFLMSVAKHIISFPDLRKRKFTLEKINMEGLEGPYLMLVTHSSMVDFNVMLKATPKDVPAYVVLCTQKGIIKRTDISEFENMDANSFEYRKKHNRRR